MIIDFEITCDQKFIERFYDKRDFYLFSPQMVEKLRCSNDAYGKYGYGRWLYITGSKNKDNLRIVRDCIEFAAENGIPDAIYVLSRLYGAGFYVNDEKKGIMEWSPELAEKYLNEAAEKGSELARMEILMSRYQSADHDAKEVIEEIKKIADEPGASLLWLEQYGWCCQDAGYTDEAIAAYEKCIAAGLKHTIFDLAVTYYDRGNVAYYESLMEEGIEKEVPSCMLYGFEDLEEWDSYDEETRNEIHNRFDKNIRRGVEMGEGLCASYFAQFLLEGLLGYEKDVVEAMRYARKGMDANILKSYQTALEIMEMEGIEDVLPQDLLMSKEEVQLLRLQLLRRGKEDLCLNYVIDESDEYDKLGYEDEMAYWCERYLEKIGYYTYEGQNVSLQLPFESRDDDDDDCKDADKTEIEPTVLVIHPSGMVDFVEADSKTLSYSEVSGLIGADGYDAVHTSYALEKITKDCGLKKNVALYVDKNGIAKDLPDNAIGTMLYGHGYEIRGAIVVALEDKKYNTCAFVTEEDAEAVYDAINEFTGGLLKRDAPDDDGRYDAWA